ncbi:rubrerythrin [Chloroflexota bacterium]
MELKGSKTEKNLETAFNRESQVRNKYTYFAEVAEEEGLNRIARVFRETANNEKVHAQKELEFLKMISDTEANLKVAAGGEHEEWTKMYPEFERIAREEGFNDIADFFKRINKIEEQHEKRYLELLKDIQESSVYKKDHAVTWKCTSCGWFTEELEAPVECPTCKVPKSQFHLGTEVFTIH